MGPRRFIGRIAAAVLAVSTAGCGYFPNSGPTVDAIQNQAQFVSLSPAKTQLNYVLIQLEPRLLSALSSEKGYGFGFSSHPPPADIRPGVGDLLSVTIFEAGPGGLFTPEGGKGEGAAAWTELPPQTVDRNGEILVPYGGKVRVAGRSILEIEHNIEELIKNRAIDPKVIVSIREQRASQVSVLGEVSGATTIPIPAGGLRVLEAISRAGGIRIPGYEARVTLQRKGRPQSVAFDEIVYSQNNNIFLEPGDVVYVSREPRTFIALGAFGSLSSETQGQFTFDGDSLSLMDAIGKAKGFIDLRANPGTAFVFRLESREMLRRLEYPVEDYPGPLVPTIYKVSFSDPSGYFLAQQFQVRNKDVLYVANAQSVDMTKFILFAQSIITPVAQGIGSWGVINGIVTGTGSTAVVPTTVAVPSDIRLKRDIHLVATLDSGMKIYSFKYLWSDTTYVGVMAQDLLANPAWCHAVITSPSGFYQVNYGALGLKMVTLEEWKERGVAAIQGVPLVVPKQRQALLRAH